MVTEPSLGIVYFGLDHVQLIFEDEALEAIAEEALARNTGARGLRAIMEQFMMKLMYELPSDELADTVTITRAFIKGEADAVITHRTPALPEAEQPVIALPEASSEEA